MRASLFSVVMVAGIAAMSVGCSKESDEAGEGASRVTSQITERQEYECKLNDGRVVQVYPDGAEVHWIDPKLGTWSMQDGLTFEQTPISIAFRDGEGKPVGSISKLGFYAEQGGKVITGVCARSWVSTLKATSRPFSIDDSLEYACKTEDGAVNLVVRPKLGAIDVTRVDEGKFSSVDGVAFELASLETSPPKNQLRGKDEDGKTDITVLETDGRITFERADVKGSCEKFSRRRE